MEFYEILPVQCLDFFGILQFNLFALYHKRAYSTLTDCFELFHKSAVANVKDFFKSVRHTRAVYQVGNENVFKSPCVASLWLIIQQFWHVEIFTCVCGLTHFVTDNMVVCSSRWNITLRKAVVVVVSLSSLKNYLKILRTGFVWGLCTKLYCAFCCATMGSECLPPFSPNTSLDPHLSPKVKMLLRWDKSNV